MNTDTTQGKQNSRTSAKGRIRREQLMNAAAQLLESQSPDQISLKEIAQHAGVPVGSAYHFYADANAVFTSLAEQFMLTLRDAAHAPYSGKSIESWQSIFAESVDRAVAIYRENTAYCQLILGGKTPSEIKLADRGNDEFIADHFDEIISLHFEFAHFPNFKNVFFYATEAVDLLLSLSVIRHGEITEEMAKEAKKIGLAYLRNYMPHELPPKVIAQSD